MDICSVKLNSYLFSCKFYSPKAEYKVNTSPEEKEEEKYTQNLDHLNDDNGRNYYSNDNNNNSINRNQSYH
jgi:hypothetical protein